jgi:hypothetical protein
LIHEALSKGHCIQMTMTLSLVALILVLGATSLAAAMRQARRASLVRAGEGRSR